MLYIRDNAKDYDGWGVACGWSYKDVLPHLLKSEDNKDPKITNLIKLMLSTKKNRICTFLSLLSPLFLIITIILINLIIIRKSSTHFMPDGNYIS